MSGKPAHSGDILANVYDAVTLIPIVVAIRGNPIVAADAMDGGEQASETLDVIVYSFGQGR